MSMWVHELVGFCFDGWGYFSGCVCGGFTIRFGGRVGGFTV